MHTTICGCYLQMTRTKGAHPIDRLAPVLRRQKITGWKGFPFCPSLMGKCVSSLLMGIGRTGLVVDALSTSHVINAYRLLLNVSVKLIIAASGALDGPFPGPLYSVNVFSAALVIAAA
eukprot:9925320-Ditylum_brightwellii.AAC.1